MATTQQYEQINTCLYHVAFILKKIGVLQFNVLSDRRYVEWDTQQEVDQDLLDRFCELTGKLYHEFE